MLSFKSLAVKKSMMLEEANSNNFNNSGCGSHGNPLSSALTSTTTNLKASSSPSQNGLLTKKKYSQGYGLALTPSQLFEQYTAGLNSSNSAQYAKQQHQMQQQSQQQQSQTAVNAPTTATINLISLQDKQVGLPVQPLAQQQQQQQSQQNEDKRSKSSGSQNKNLGKVSKTPQLTPILNSSQCEDSAPRGKSSQQQRQNGSTSQYQQIGSQLQSQQPQYQSSNLYQSSQQNNSNNHHSSSSSSSAQKKQSLKVNLYSSNQYQTSSSAAGTTATGNSAIPGSISKTNSSNIFHRKSNSTQLNKNFFDQSSQPQQQQQQQHTYLGESTASMGVNNPTQSSTVTNTGLGNGNTSLSLQQSGSNAIANNHHKMATSTLKSKIKISNYQGLVFGNNSNLQMDSTRSLNINLHLNNQNGGGSSSLTSSQYNPATTTTTYSQNLRASKNNFLNMESNSETTTPKHTVSKLYQSSLLSSNLQNNENIDYLAAPHSTKGERFPNLNMSHKPTHQRVNSDKVYKQIHQSLKNQSNQKSNKQSENTLGMSGQFQDANESSLMDNRTKDLQNQLKSSLMQQYQLQQQQQNQQKQSSGFTQNQSNQQMSYSGQNLQHQLAQQQQSQQSTKSNSTQQQSQLLDYSQLLYQQRNNPSSSMSTNNGYSHHSQSHHLHQRGNETNDMDEAATTSANSYSHTNGSPSNKNQSNNVNNNNNGYSQNNLMNSKEGSEYDNRQSLNNNNNTSSNNNNNYLSKYNSLRSSSKGLSLDSGSTPQPKFEVIKSSLSSQNQHQQAQQTNSSSQAHNQVSNLNNSQSNNTPHQQNGNQMSVKVNQSGQINLYSNKVKKSISTAGLTNNTTSSGSTTQTLETLRKQFANPNSFQSQQQSPVQQPMSSLPFQPLFNSQVSSTKSIFTPPQKMNQSNHYADIASQQQSQQQFQLSSSVDSSLMQAAVAAATNNSNNLRKTKEAMNFNYQNQLGLSHSQQFGVGGGHKKNAASLPGYSSLYNSTGFNSSALYSNNNNINENTNNTPQKSNLNTSNPQQQQQQQMLILQQQQQQQQQEQQQQQILISSFCVKSKPGSLPNKPIKTNQDSYIVFPSFCNNKNKFLFSVCDGHGSNGHLVSQFIKKKLPTHIEQCLKTKGNDFELQSVRQSLIQAYLKTADELKEQPLDTQLSGSTSVLLYINQKRIWCANLGDSRAICARTNKTEWTAISLSIDQKPDNEKERIRIVANGGRVEPYKDYYGNPLGPYRVWLSSENMPGLAMARSFGDQIAQSVGVISEPEVNCFEITDDDRFLVIASDGVWEFLSNEKVVSLVTPYYLKNDAEGACDRLIKESTAMWKKEDEVVDDITAIVVFLNKNPSGESSSKNSNLQDSVFLNTLKRSSLNMEHS